MEVSMNYSILIMSCDKYVSLLDVFFRFFCRFYDTSNTKVYLSLEKQNYKNNDANIIVFNDQDAIGWSHRLKKCLEKIETKAVLILLDDFIIESNVNTEEIERLSRLIISNDNIAHFALTTVPMKNDSNSTFFDSYYKRYRFGRYKTTLQAGLWNKEELISVLSDEENPWEVEIFANIRSFISHRDYYAIVDKKLKPIDYNDGFFCLQGKINELECKRLSEKFGEEVKVAGIPSNNGVVVRNASPLLRRIVFRLKIIFYWSVYRFRYFWRKTREKKV